MYVYYTGLHITVSSLFPKPNFHVCLAASDGSTLDRGGTLGRRRWKRSTYTLMVGGSEGGREGGRDGGRVGGRKGRGRLFMLHSKIMPFSI